MTDVAAGDEPTADVFNTMTRRVKTSAQNLNSSTTPTADAELSAPVDASTTYIFQSAVFFTADTTSDIKFACAFPTGATCAWAGIRLVTSATVTGDADFGAYSSATSGSSTIAAAGTGAPQLTWITGSVTVGATAGSLTLQWAQNTSTGTNITVHAGSYLLLYRV